MSQNDFSIANQAGASFRADVNSALQALASCSSDGTEPATKYAYQLWSDTSTSPATLKQRNGANDAWISIGKFDGSTIDFIGGQILRHGPAAGSPPTYASTDVLRTENGSADAYHQIVSPTSGKGGIGFSDNVKNRGKIEYDHSVDSLTIVCAGITVATLSATGIFTLVNAINEIQGTNIASAGTTDIGAATGNFVQITGTTTITALGTIAAGVERVVYFAGALTLTHNGTSLILPGGKSIVTVAGDSATFRSLGSGNWKCIDFTRIDGSATNDQQGADIASATTTDIGAGTGNFVQITGTTTITGLGTVRAGKEVTVYFAAALTLTYNGTSLKLPGGKSIVTAANDSAIFRSLGSGNWLCVNYIRFDGSNINQQDGADIASATTTDIGAGTGDFIRITGTTTITGLGTVRAGKEVTVYFAAALTLTHNGTSLILPGAASIVTAANDRAIFRSLGSGNWLCIVYQKADGSSVVAGSGGVQAKVTFNGTTNADLSGTYSQSGTTVTVTATAHGHKVGHKVQVTIGTGTADTGAYVVTGVTNANVFTYTAGTSLTTSGNITLPRRTIISQSNVAVVSYVGTGNGFINYTNAITTADPAIGSGLTFLPGVYAYACGLKGGTTPTTMYFEYAVYQYGGGAYDGDRSMVIVA